MNLSQAYAVAQGRTWYGSQALREGLVDRLGGFDAAIALGKEKAGLSPDATVDLMLFNERRTWFEELIKHEGDDELAFQLSRVLVEKLFGHLGFIHKVPFFSAYAATILDRKTQIFPMMETSTSYR